MSRISALDDRGTWYPNASVVCDEGEVELRWDWLENGTELATEASVFGNPNGDRFYAVWNQELPMIDDHGAISTDMDIEFRRIFYNLGDVDAYPTTTSCTCRTAAAGQTNGDVLTFVGTRSGQRPYG